MPVILKGDPRLMMTHKSFVVHVVGTRINIGANMASQIPRSDSGASFGKRSESGWCQSTSE